MRPASAQVWAGFELLPTFPGAKLARTWESALSDLRAFQRECCPKPLGWSPKTKTGDLCLDNFHVGPLTSLPFSSWVLYCPTSLTQRSKRMLQRGHLSSQQDHPGSENYNQSNPLHPLFHAPSMQMLHRLHVPCLHRQTSCFITMNLSWQHRTRRRRGGGPRKGSGPTAGPVALCVLDGTRGG